MKQTIDNMTRIYRIKKKVTVGEADIYYADYQLAITIFGVIIPIFCWRPTFNLPYQLGGYGYISCERAQKAIDSHKEDIIKARNRSNAKTIVINNECNESI